MNKKILIGVIIIIIIVGLGIIGYAVINKNRNSNKYFNEIVKNDEQENNSNKLETEKNKTLVVYFSAQSHTKSVAEKISNNLNADLFEIVPEDIYTNEDLNWTNSNSRVSREHNDEKFCKRKQF